MSKAKVESKTLMQFPVGSPYVTYLLNRAPELVKDRVVERLRRLTGVWFDSFASLKFTMRYNTSQLLLSPKAFQ
jgi:hypothetical protein